MPFILRAFIDKSGVTPSVIGLLMCFLFSCNTPAKRSAAKASAVQLTTFIDSAHYYYQNSNRQQAIVYFDKAFAQFRTKGQTDSLLFYSEPYLVCYERLESGKPLHAYLADLQQRILSETPVDSIKYSILLERQAMLDLSENNPHRAQQTMETVLAIRLRHLKYPDFYIADAYDYLQGTNEVNGNYKMSIAYGLKGIAAYKDLHNSTRSENLMYVLRNTSGACYEAGIYDLAEKLAREANDSMLAFEHNYHSNGDNNGFLIQSVPYLRLRGHYDEALALLNTLHQNSVQKGEVQITQQILSEKALCYQDMGLTDSMLFYARSYYYLCRSATAETYHQRLLTSATMLAECLLLAGQADSAMHYIRIAAANNQHLPGLDSTQYYEILLARAKVLAADTATYLQAEILLNTCLHNAEKQYGLPSDKAAEVRLALAALYLSWHKHEPALDNYRQCVAIFKKQRGKYNTTLLQCLVHITEIYRQQKNYKEALLTAGEVVNAGDITFQSAAAVKLQLLYAGLISDTATGVAGYAEALGQFKRFGNYYSNLVTHASGYFSHTRFGDYNMAHGLKEASILACKLYRFTTDQQYAEQAVYFAECYRMVPVRLDLQSYLVNRLNDVPDTLLNRERSIKGNMLYYNNMLERAGNDSFYIPYKTQWQLQRDSLQQAYNNIITGYQKGYPNYYNLKFNNPTANLSTIRKALPAGAAMLMYLCNDSLVYLIGITANEVAVISATLKNEWLQQMRGGHDNRYASYALYKNLLYAFVNSAPQVSKLYVLPDGGLYNLSFEGLVTDTAARSKGLASYVIAQYNISYLLSATQALYFKDKAATSETRMLAIAPGFDTGLKTEMRNKHYTADTTWFNYLQQPFSVALAKNISQTWNAAAITGADATAALFMAQSKTATVLHLGTHAVANNDNPLQSKIVFSPPAYQGSPYVFAHQLYSLHIPAQLAVLSACETGTGVYREGEGLQSLANGFYYAGCRSMITTLWPVDEQSTSDILRLFYDNLGQHMASADALHQAKKDFVQQNPARSAPAYWAGIVLLGNSEVITLPAAPVAKTAWLIMVVLLVMLTAYFYLRKKERKI